MDLAAAFLLSLLGGYCFAYVWRAVAFTTKRSDGHHLYFRASLCGVIFFFMALALRLALEANFPAYLKLDSALVEYIAPALKAEPGLTGSARTRRAEWVLTALYSLLLGVTCGAMGNVFTPGRWASKRSAGELDRLLLDAHRDNKPVMLSLNTGKVYIGIVLEIPNPVREPMAVRILPMFSGYRDAESRLNLTTDYETLYSSLSHGRAAQLGLTADWSSEFKLTIRASEIVTAALFSAQVYGEFNPGWREQMAKHLSTSAVSPSNDSNAGPTPLRAHS
jgi:hypothetical protein